MMRIVFGLLLVSLLFLAACARPVPPQDPAYHFNPPDRQLDYLADVEPVLVKRCVVCHSCYNSPCQLKLSSWDGLDRGASKEMIYNAGRLKTMDPSRLFVDAHSTAGWRDRGFYGVTPAEGQNYAESIIVRLLDHKRLSPAVSGDYFPEADDLTCAENDKELDKYLKKHPNRGMPFGFPPLSQEEFSTVAGWLMQGARGPSAEQRQALSAVDPADRAMVDTWETFLNTPDAKHRMTARYLYEHLFLAHVTFGTGSARFYELVRSGSAPGEAVEIIATVRPYDDPGSGEVYYRFRAIYSTIVHKTHMVVPLGREQLERVDELFIRTPWHGEPRVADYDPIASANPFVTFEQIPPRSRYAWLLDNARYVIMTFIRGPVCKGQVALNVINDHFWIMFLDPEYDLSVRFPGFLKVQAGNLRMPAERGSDYSIVYPDGLDASSIWPGRRPDDAPLMTVFRHFDSASVHRGLLGNLPKTAWVIDYPLFERIYYALVAGFDIYGTAGHQLATRFYMDALRIEGESYFLDYLPEARRKPTMASWYIGIDEEDLHYYPAPIPAKTAFATDEPKRELFERLVGERIIVDGIGFDRNYLPAGQPYPSIPPRIETREEAITGFVAVSAPGVSFFRHLTDHNANVAWVRITEIPGREDMVVSMVIDRWHDSVRFVFREASTLDPSKDEAEFIPGFISSYPNYFFVVRSAEIHAFLETLDTYDGSDSSVARLEHYGINRADPDFWTHYDWFQEAFNASDPVHAGLVDLNRYFYRAGGEEAP